MNELATAPAGLQLSLECDRTINFAMQQNDVPIVRQVRITNATAAAVDNLSVRISSEPELFPNWETPIATVPAGGTYTLGPIDLRLSANLLMGLTERMGGTLRVELAQNGQVLSQALEPIEMLSFDEWNGLGRSLPELLAAFVLPNHPEVERLLADAAKWLAEKTGDGALSGYQSRNPARIGQMMQAIYVAVQNRGISYCNPPASFENTGQKVRLPDRILEHKLATCLDLALLTAAGLEQAGLFPIVVMTQDHAFVGGWLVEECFADCSVDDLLRLRKRVDLNEILVFETTLTTAPPPNDFGTAVAAAKRHLAAASEFHCAIDIQRCRRSRIRPLPIRATTEPAHATHPTNPNDTASAVFELPAVPALKGGRKPEAETPATRVDKWKRKLLDLTLRNRLLNFRPSKKTVPLLCPDLTTLEDALADGREFQVLARPTEFASDAPRSAELHRARTGADALDQLLRSEFQSHRLRADVTDQELRGRLTEIYRAARTATEEGGASALYLALGFLAWYEADAAEQPRLAPLILVPVELRRASVQEGFRFCQSDEEPRINITLLELLAKDYALRVPNMEPVPEDEHGIDVRGILTTFRQAIKNTPRWDVVEDAQIGFFSFTKFLMWRDLERRAKDLLRNKVVDHLVNRPHERYPDDGGFPVESALDETHRPQETFCPLLSDASQLAAVYAASSGKSFVLFGPPGTGKSQTITNLIAHSLAGNKSVLFVSEKMAALNVVHRRLSQCGLGPFCLELHSNKSNKRYVIEQLGQALDYRAAQSQAEWGREASRLAAVRAELNAYVQALHRTRGLGESVFQATSRLIGLREVAPLSLKLDAPENVSREQLDRWKDLIEKIKTATAIVGPPAANAWSTCGIKDWSPAIQRAIESDLDALLGLSDRLEACIQLLGPALGLGTAWNVSYLEFAEKFLALLMTPPFPPAALLTEADWNAAEASITAWLTQGRQRDRLRGTLYARYDDRILRLDLDGLTRRLTNAWASWFLRRWCGIRAVRNVLARVARQREKQDVHGLAQDLAEAKALRDAEQRLAEAGAGAQVLLGPYWKDGEADWNVIEALRDWAGKFRKFANAVAGDDPEKTSAFLKRWTQLLGESQAALQPEGDLGRAVAEFRLSYADFTRLAADLAAKLAGGPNLWGPEPKRVTLRDIRAKLSGWKSNRAGLRPWCSWRQVRQEAGDAGLGPLLDALERDGIPGGELWGRFARGFYEEWVEAVTEREETLRRFFSAEHERKVRQFREIDENYAQLTKAEIQARLAVQRPAAAERVNESSEMGILQRQRQLRRSHLPVRQLFQKIPHLLHRLKPCLLMSPISVAQYLDASHPPFDIVVFDEASQIPVWDAIGAVARGKEAVIVGDPKQLPPTNFFERADEQELNDDDVIEEMESILDECLSARIPQMQLRWHYRSRHEGLIAFSNYHYYENSLLTFPSPFVGKGVSHRHVPGGVYDKGKSRTNRAEAEAVVAEVVRRLRDPDLARLSIGVVTFSMAQQELVEDLLDEVRRRHPEIEPFFGGDAAEPVFIKNLENVQGDERDVILFSVCYGPDAEGRVSMNFGPLNRDGGERRLNVAITRARCEVLVFAALKAEQIDLSRTLKRGVQDLKCFLDYAERGPVAIAQALSPRGGAEFDSPFERVVCQRLRERGHEVHPQVGCSGYRIDLAIVDLEAPGRYLLGIECDGANYHSAKTARDRDRLRENVLVGLGWRLHRVWSSDWWANPEECLARIEAAIEQAKIARPPPPPPPAVPVTKIAEAPLTKASEEKADAKLGQDKKEAPPLPAYQAYSMTRRLGSSEEFYLAATDPVIRKLIEEIVQYEGPVALEVVGRRVAAHWGLNRLGPNIRERIAEIARGARVQFIRHGDLEFLWSLALDPLKYGLFRVPGPRIEDQREIEEIPPEEIAAAAVHVLRRQVSLPSDGLIRETALVFGFQRAGQAIQRTVAAAIQWALARGALQSDEAGRVRLS